VQGNRHNDLIISGVIRKVAKIIPSKSEPILRSYTHEPLAILFMEKRAITFEEHQRIIAKLARRRPVVPVSVPRAYRAMEFKSRFRQLGIVGVTLHSYRYAWAECAKTCGMPERFAQAQPSGRQLPPDRSWHVRR
jgi:hypothetical protein